MPSWDSFSILVYHDFNLFLWNVNRKKENRYKNGFTYVNKNRNLELKQ